MLNKNDPLIGVVQEVMKRNQAERDAVKVVNEKFGIQDRKVLPHERQHEWETVYKTVLSESIDPSKYSKKQTQLAAVAGNKKKIDAPDLAAARKGGASHIDEEQIDELSRATLKSYIKKNSHANEKERVEKIMDMPVGDERTAAAEKEAKRREGRRKAYQRVRTGTMTVRPQTKKYGLKEDAVDNVGKGENEGGSAVTVVKKPAKTVPNPTSVTPDQQKNLTNTIKKIMKEEVLPGRKINGAGRTDGNTFTRPSTAAVKRVQPGQPGSVPPAAVKRVQPGQPGSVPPKKVTPTGNPNMAGSGSNVGSAPKPTARPAAPKPIARPAAPNTAARPKAAAPKVTPVRKAAPTAPAKRKMSPLQQQMARSKTGRDSGVGPNGRFK